MLNGMCRPTHVLTSSRHEELILLALIYAVANAHLNLGKRNLKYKAPKGTSPRHDSVRNN